MSTIAIPVIENLRPIDVPMIKNGPSMYLNDKKWPIDVPIKAGTPIHVPHFRKKKGPIDVPGILILRPMFAAHPYNHFCTEYLPRAVATPLWLITERHRCRVELKSTVYYLPWWAKQEGYRFIGKTLLAAWSSLCGKWRLRSYTNVIIKATSGKLVWKQHNYCTGYPFTAASSYHRGLCNALHTITSPFSLCTQ